MENEIIKTENVGAIIDATSINSDLLAQAIVKSTGLKEMRKVMRPIISSVWQLGAM